MHHYRTNTWRWQQYFLLLFALEIIRVANTQLVFYVDPSSPNLDDCGSLSTPCATIYAAMIQCNGQPAEVVLLPGEYSESSYAGISPYNNVYMRSFKEQGGNNINTIIQGKDSASGNYFMNPSNIQNMTFEGLSFTGFFASAFSIGLQSQIEFIDCVFSDNSNAFEGGAVYISQSSVTFTNCEFKSNSASMGGALYVSQCNGEYDIVLDNCKFSENSASIEASALDASQSTIHLHNVKFTKNSGESAIYCSQSSLYFSGDVSLEDNCGNSLYQIACDECDTIRGVDIGCNADPTCPATIGMIVALVVPGVCILGCIVLCVVMRVRRSRGNHRLQTGLVNTTPPEAPVTRKIPVIEPEQISGFETDPLLPASSESSSVCKVCFERPIEAVLLECGHTALCIECAQRVKTCPFCRKPVVKIVRVYRV